MSSKAILDYFSSGIKELFSIAYNPPLWHEIVAEVSTGLRPDFCLRDIIPLFRSSSRLRSLLFRLVSLPFCLVTIIVLVNGFLQGWPPYQILQAVAFACMTQLSVTTIFGVTTSYAAGSVFGLILGIGFGILTPGNASNIYYPIGFSLGVAGSIMATISKANYKTNLYKKVRGILTAHLILLLVYLAARISLSGALSQHVINPDLGVNLASRIKYGSISWLIFSIILLLTTTLRGYSLQQSCVISLSLGFIGGLCFFIYAGLLDHSPLFFITGGLGDGILFSILFGFFWAVTSPVSGSWVGATVAALASGLVWIPFHSLVMVNFEYDVSKVIFLIALIFLTLTRHYWRPMLSYPLLLFWTRLLYFLDETFPSKAKPFIRFHPIFWTRMQPLPWLNLDNHLILIMNQNPDLAKLYMRKIALTDQRWAVQSAQVEMAASFYERCETITEISRGYESSLSGEFPGNASELLNSLSQISHDIATALKQTSLYHKRLTLGLVQERLQMVDRELMISNTPFAVRFNPIIDQWGKIISAYLEDLAEISTQGIPIVNPYICGTPITPEQQMFVGRADIIARIDKLLLEPSGPPLLLYGQRRMGKTSLMLNLGRILPSSFVPLFIDCQGLSGSETYVDLLSSFARQINRASKKQRDVVLPSIDHNSLTEKNSFLNFHLWLDEMEDWLEKTNTKALLMLDEFETIDLTLRTGSMQPDIFFNLLRHIIQHRGRFKVLLAGSHTMDELKSWSAHLVNTQLLKIAYLERWEAHQLIEYPVPQFQLAYSPASIEKIIDLTRGHPQLVQQICFELVELKNEQSAILQKLVTEEDVETVIPRTLKSASMFFLDIQNNQIAPQAFNFLRSLAVMGPGAVKDPSTMDNGNQVRYDDILSNLLQRDLIEAATGGYRFQIELVRRWFSKKD